MISNPSVRNMGVGLCLAASLSAIPGEGRASERVDLKAETCRGFFLLPVSLGKADNQDESADKTIHFIYDTGASTNVIDPDALEQISGRTIVPDRWVRLTDGKIGDLAFKSLRAKTVQLDHLSLALGRPVDGILAHDAFADFLISLDYETGAAKLYKGALPQADDRTVFSTTGPDARPWISVEIGDHTRRLLIDSGSTSTFALRHLNRYPTQSPPVSLSTSVRFKRVEHTRYARLTTSATFGDFSVQTPIVSSVPQTELFGIGILKHFDVIYDAGNRRLKLERTASGPIVTPSEYAFGLYLRPHRTGFQIDRVLPHGPAANLDLRKGDILTHMNGHAIAERGCEDISEPGLLTVTRQRDGSSRDVVIDMSQPMVD